MMDEDELAKLEAFIAAASTAVPALIAEVRWLRERENQLVSGQRMLGAMGDVPQSTASGWYCDE
jgi:hypothetical protein